jgi:hypothetical protein
MDDWVGVFTIVVVCGGVATLLVAILRLSGPEERAQYPNTPATRESPNFAPEEPPDDRPPPRS